MDKQTPDSHRSDQSDPHSKPNNGGNRIATNIPATPEGNLLSTITTIGAFEEFNAFWVNKQSSLESSKQATTVYVHAICENNTLIPALNKNLPDVAAVLAQHRKIYLNDTKRENKPLRHRCTGKSEYVAKSPSPRV